MEVENWKVSSSRTSVPFAKEKDGVNLDGILIFETQWEETDVPPMVASL